MERMPKICRGLHLTLRILISMFVMKPPEARKNTLQKDLRENYQLCTKVPGKVLILSRLENIITHGHWIEYTEGSCLSGEE